MNHGFDAKQSANKKTPDIAAQPAGLGSCNRVISQLGFMLNQHKNQLTDELEKGQNALMIDPAFVNVGFPEVGF